MTIQNVDLKNLQEAGVTRLICIKDYPSWQLKEGNTYKVHYSPDYGAYIFLNTGLFSSSDQAMLNTMEQAALDCFNIWQNS